MTDLEARRPIALVAFTRRGAQMATLLAERLTGARAYIEKRWAQGSRLPFRTFSLPLRPLVEELFQIYPSLVLFASVGVTVRLIAPLIKGKGSDPAVVAVDEGGRFAVCLLSGHQGRGEALAKEVASLLGAIPVITSASGALGVPSLELVGSQWGWRREGDEHLKAIAAALINAQPVVFYQEAGEKPWATAPAGIVVAPSLDEALASPLPCIIVSDREVGTGRTNKPMVVFRPRSIVAGVGCRRGALGDEIAAFIRDVLKAHGFSPLSLRCLATMEAKALDPSLQDAASLLGVPLEAVPRATLLHFASRVSPSASERLLGLPSVSEASALAVSGAATLLGPRASNGKVTVALARWEPQP